MKHISILIPEGDSSLSNLEAGFKMFSMVNENLQRKGFEPIFNVQLVGSSKKSKSSNKLFSIQPQTSIHEIEHTDLIIIPAVHGDKEEIIRLNQKLISWIEKMHKKGAEVASLCLGAFILAAAGLLDGRKCATHWLASEEFREMFPSVNLIDDKIITDENGLYTSGGAYSSLNLILYLVEKYAGREMAILSSKIFEIDISRNSQLPFIIFSGQKEHGDPAVLKAQDYIEKNYADKITVDELADMSAVSRRSLERRFKKSTGNTVFEYIQRVKIEAAKKSFENSGKNIHEVMYDIGYSDIKSFRMLFRKIANVSPLEYRKKYFKEAVPA